MYFLKCRDLISGFSGLQGRALGMSSGPYCLLIFVTRLLEDLNFFHRNHMLGNVDLTV